MGLKKFVKRLVKKVTPRPLRRLVDKSLESFLDPKAGLKELKRQGKSAIRKPGKWLKPKIPEPDDPVVIETPDEETLGKAKKRRRSARRGSRSSSMMSDTLG